MLIKCLYLKSNKTEKRNKAKSSPELFSFLYWYETSTALHKSSKIQHFRSILIYIYLFIVISIYKLYMITRSIRKVSCMHTMDFDDHIPVSWNKKFGGLAKYLSKRFVSEDSGKVCSCDLLDGGKNPVPCHCPRPRFLVWATLGGTHSLPHVTASSGKYHHNLISHVPSISCEEDPYAFVGFIQ